MDGTKEKKKKRRSRKVPSLPKGNGLKVESDADEYASDQDLVSPPTTKKPNSRVNRAGVQQKANKALDFSAANGKDSDDDNGKDSGDDNASLESSAKKPSLGFFARRNKNKNNQVEEEFSSSDDESDSPANTIKSKARNTGNKITPAKKKPRIEHDSDSESDASRARKRRVRNFMKKSKSP